MSLFIPINALFWFLYVLSTSDQEGLDRTVLDCGADGSRQALVHFAEWVHEGRWVGISEKQIKGPLCVATLTQP